MRIIETQLGCATRRIGREGGSPCAALPRSGWLQAAGSCRLLLESDGKTMDDLTISAREYAYRLFAILLREELAAPTLGVLKDPDTFRRLSYFETAGSGADGARAGYRAALDEVREACSRIEDVEPVRDEYTRLFLGPNKLEAPPWESAYLGKGHVIMQPSTLEVRSCYLSEGLLPGGYPSVADDHVAIELDFMARVSGKMLEAYDEGDGEALERHLEAQRRFLKEHLLGWMPGYLAALEAARRAEFYPAVVRLVYAFLRIDSLLIGA